MAVLMTEGQRVIFVMREALFEIYTWILCLSYLHEKQTSRIQSLIETVKVTGAQHNSAGSLRPSPFHSKLDLS